MNDLSSGRMWFSFIPPSNSLFLVLGPWRAFELTLCWTLPYVLLLELQSCKETVRGYVLGTGDCQRQLPIERAHLFHRSLIVKSQQNWVTRLAARTGFWVPGHQVVQAALPWRQSKERRSRGEGLSGGNGSGHSHSGRAIKMILTCLFASEIPALIMPIGQSNNTVKNWEVVLKLPCYLA